MENNVGRLVISLDYELFWGVKDVFSIEEYSSALDGVPKAIDLMLDLFRENHIEATWAVVGALINEDIIDLREALPVTVPNYTDDNLSPYGLIRRGWDRQLDKYFFAKNTVVKIKNTPGQSIGSHTFSHYFSMEPGQVTSEFEHDVHASLNVFSKIGVAPKSFVFPRNQINPDHLKILSKNKFMCYRGVEESKLYHKSTFQNDSIYVRLGRLLDSYINISGHNTYSVRPLVNEGLLNLPSSRFLRPYNTNLRLFEKIRMKRIKESMTFAAKNKEIFHLWWHPHNFGNCTTENMLFLKEVIDHFIFLNNDYGMKSCSMESIAFELRGGWDVT